MTTKFPNGVSTAVVGSSLAELPAPDPTRYVTYFNDFVRPTDYDTTDWTITTVELGAGLATEVIQNLGTGILLLTNAAGDNDLDSLQLAKETFKFVAGKKSFFKCRLKVSDAIQSDWLVGLAITDISPLINTDGVYFRKDDGDANIDFEVTKASTSTSKLAIATNVTNTFITLGFYYNGIDAIVAYVDDVAVSSVVVTNLPDTQDLTLTLHIQNGEAVAKTMSVDYLFVSQER